jgi:hypothetical protein
MTNLQDMFDDANACKFVKHSRGMLGKTHSQETRDKFSKDRKGKKIHTEESRAKISAKSKQQIVSQETINKRVEKLKGQKRTPEQIERFRLAAIKTYENKPAIFSTPIGCFRTIAEAARAYKITGTTARGRFDNNRFGWIRLENQK